MNSETSSALSGTLAISRTGTETAAGTYSGVLQPSGLSSNNYTITYQPGNFTIVPSGQLLVRVTDVASIYGAATTYAINRVEYENAGTVYRLDNGTITNSSVAINSSNSVTINDGASGVATFSIAPLSALTSTAGKLKVGTYQIGVSGTVTENSANFSGTITVLGSHQVDKKALTISGITAANKVYDATTASTISVAGVTSSALQSGGMISGDLITVSATGVFDTKNVGTGKTVTLTETISGADAGNYTITKQGTTTANVTPKALTISGLTSANKTYDGTTKALASGTAVLQSAQAAGAGTSSDGIAFTGDTVSLSGTALGAFNSQNVATATTVNFSGLSLTGADAANYSLTQGSAAHTITARTLNVSYTGVDKVYDRTATATVSTTDDRISGDNHHHQPHSRFCRCQRQPRQLGQRVVQSYYSVERVGGQHQLQLDRDHRFCFCQGDPRHFERNRCIGHSKNI